MHYCPVFKINLQVYMSLLVALTLLLCPTNLAQVNVSSTGITSGILSIGLGPLSVSSTATNITVSWPVPRLVPTSYTLVCVCALLCNDTPYRRSVSTPGPKDTSVNITGLFPGTVCNISLTGYDETQSYLEATASTTTKSERPSSASEITSISSISFTSATVLWKKVNCMYRNGPITGYILRCKSDSGTPQFIVAQNSTFSHQLKGLTACTRYTLRIATENKAGIGPFSDSMSFTTIPTANLELASNVSFLNVSPISIVMAWGAPLDDNDAIAFYEVNYTHSTISTTAKVSKAAFNLSGLDPGTKVDFVVRAVTRCETSKTVFAVTKSTEAIPIVDAMNITTLSSTAVLVSWLPIKSDYADHYLLHYYIKPAKGKRSESGSTGHEQEMKLPIDTSSTTITHLQEGFNYVFGLAVMAKINGNYYRGSTTEAILSGRSLPVYLSSLSPSATSSPEGGERHSDPLLTGLMIVLLIIIIFGIALLAVAVFNRLSMIKKRLAIGDTNTPTVPSISLAPEQTLASSSHEKLKLMDQQTSTLRDKYVSDQELDM